jgi:hypothetical protein
VARPRTFHAEPGVLIGQFLDGMSYGRLATLYGVPRSTVAGRLRDLGVRLGPWDRRERKSAGGRLGATIMLQIRASRR